MIKKALFLAMILSVALYSCNDSTKKQQKTKASASEKVEKDITVPHFNADSAYAFVKAQCDFGPRVPGSVAHKECKDYLVSTLERFAPEVMVQEAKVRAYDNSVLDCYNIIASFNPEKKARIFLSAHWDSRHVADEDPNPANHKTPIIGANDGASGVGVLLELARIMSKNTPEIGIDIILFDVEDYGTPNSTQTTRQDTWALGSQYWANNPHKFGYDAQYGILLDMVGAADAVFTQEAFSRQFAASVLKKVWDKAHELGYGDYFLYEEGTWINDDHYYVNMIAGIPTIDIIHLDPNSRNGSFFEHWHTVNDNIDIIEAETLGIVGTVVANVVYNE